MTGASAVSRADRVAAVRAQLAALPGADVRMFAEYLAQEYTGAIELPLAVFLAARAVHQEWLASCAVRPGEDQAAAPGAAAREAAQ